MLVFDALWAFGLLPLPLLVYLFSRAYKTRRAAVRSPMLKTLVHITGHQPAEGALVARRPYLMQVVISLCWCLVVVACANPQWLAEPITKIQPARDLMIAVDLSGSMVAEDFGAHGISRLKGVKQVLANFVERREHDRLGLIVFGSAPYLQVPFTLDRDLFNQLLAETRIRMAGPKTMLGDAVGLAVNHFERHESRKRVLILLTDGNDSGSRVPPLEAARVAADHGVTIHTIAIGALDAEGEQKMDSETLKSMSKRTGGEFFHAQTDAELSTIYSELDRLEPSEKKVLSYRPKSALYFWPLGLAFALLNLSYFTLHFTRWYVQRARLMTLKVAGHD